MSKRPYINIPQKANFVLRVILTFVFLLLLRVWHLSYVEHGSKMKLAAKPLRREVLEPAKRGIICDRFNIPLAVNKAEYQAAISYAAIRQVPTASYEKSADGKTIKRPLRRLYIRKLSEQVAQVLKMDADRIEDLIHSKAALYNHVPYVIKNDLTEKEYFRLKLLEKEWPGLQAILHSKRYYPHGKLASDVIGYMGSINKKEYETILHEVHALSEALEAKYRGSDSHPPEGYLTWEDAEAKLIDLKEKAYSINDMVGKGGVEASLERELRGYHGKKLFYADAKGNFLRELPGSREALSGERKLLSLSAELQKHAELLLAAHEKRRSFEHKLPWISGGAIVAMEPNTGEVLALASYPRFDPNDFILSGSSSEIKRKKQRIRHWFEQEESIGAIWDGQEPLILEEVVDGVEIEECPIYLDWELFVQHSFSKNSPFSSLLTDKFTVEDAVCLQASAKQMLDFLEQKDLLQVLNYIYKGPNQMVSGRKLGAIVKAQIEGHIEASPCRYEKIKKNLDSYFSSLSSNYDKMLLIDLSRLLVNSDNISEEFLKEAGKLKVGRFRQLECAFHPIKQLVLEETLALFEKTTFKEWRKKEEQSFLQQMRKEEKEANRCAKPYIDHLDKKKTELFTQFWKRHKWQFLTAFLLGKWQKPHPQEQIGDYLSHFSTLHALALKGHFEKHSWHESFVSLRKELEPNSLNITLQFMQALRSFEDLQRPLLGSYQGLRFYNGVQLEKSLAMSFYPKSGIGYARSFAYRHAATQGSIFKLVTGYAALKQQFEQLQGKPVSFNALNPLHITDHYSKVQGEEILGAFANGKPIPRHYKGGRMPRSLSKGLGELDILEAIERSSNPYFALLAGDVLKSPEQLVFAAKQFSFGEKTGIDLPYEIKGKVPNDVDIDKTGLYGFAIGQHTLTVTPLQTAVMLSAIANQGTVFKPKLSLLSYGQKPLYGEHVFQSPSYPYQKEMKNGGIHYPLFTKLVFEDPSYKVSLHPPEVKRTLFFPQEIYKLLVQGMGRVVKRLHNYSVHSLKEVFRDDPSLVDSFDVVVTQLAGKTSTGEVKERIGLEGEESLNIYNDVWFGGIAYKEPLPKDLQATHFPEPELVVVVYLRYGTYGKDALPLASSMVEKWRKIQSKFNSQ